jgi:hypothetical protein
LSEDEHLWKAVEMLTAAVGELFDFALTTAKERNELAPLQRFLPLYGEGRRSARPTRSGQCTSRSFEKRSRAMYSPPILGFDDREPPMRVQWTDGTRLTYCGILGPLDAEWLKDYQDRLRAEADYKQKLHELRDQGVVILEDIRNEKQT